jgi:hypothetical protein
MWVRSDILCILFKTLHVQLKIFYPRPGLETHTYRTLPLPIRQLRSLQCTIPMRIIYKSLLKLHSILLLYVLVNCVTRSIQL